MHLDLMIVGNLIVDDIVFEDGSTLMRQAGGAVLYMGLTAPLWGLKTGVVSIAGMDFPGEMLSLLRERGVEVSGVRTLSRPGLRAWLLYEGDVRRVVHRHGGATHLQASPSVEDIPPDWVPKAVHVAPMPIDRQRALSSHLRARFGDTVMLSLDPFEPLREENLAAWQERALDLDLFFASEDEMAVERGQVEPLSVLQDLVSGRIDTVFYKQGYKGGLALYDGGARRLEWPAREAGVTDTTGAGDAFATGVLAGLIQGKTLVRALEWGVVSASFAIEGQGVAGLLEATAEGARDRLAEWFES